jgi:DNA-3-methyladenine glycosylase I
MLEAMPTDTKDSQERCPWCLGFQEYIDYHDKEWGVRVNDDQKHFEFMILEGAQAGLSWSTILKKREGYKKAFAGFDYKKVALYTEEKVQGLMQNPDIIRNQLKIRSAITNAQKFQEVQKEFGSFNAYIWSFVGGKPIQNEWVSMKEVPATTPESDALSKDLKKRGFKFVGSTIMYAHMQACGLVNDHLEGCHRYQDIARI